MYEAGALLPLRWLYWRQVDTSCGAGWIKKYFFPASWPTYLNVIKTKDEFNADTNENDLLLENEQILEGSGRQLDRGRRLLKETEDIGAGVLSDLGETHR